MNGYADQQHSVEEALRVNARAVAGRVTEMVDQSGVDTVFVCGEVRARTGVIAELPPRVRQHVTQLPAGWRGHRLREGEARTIVDGEFERRRQVGIDEAIVRLRAELGRHSGRAAQGLEAVCAELREGAVEALIIADTADAIVVAAEDRATVAPDADALSELGEAPRRVARADEALPFAALRIGASIVTVDGWIDLVDGVGALLRYAPTTNTSTSDAASRPRA